MTPRGQTEHFIPVRDYDLAATLDSGQAFRWERDATGTKATPGSTERPRSAAGRAGFPDLSPRGVDTAPAHDPRFSSWQGILAGRWVQLTPTRDGILARTVVPVEEWAWLTHYLQTAVDLEAVLRSFPDDEPMRASVAGCRGLRLLRQEPWECLVSFICSSTKQIVQIRQIVRLLCAKFGEPIAGPAGHAPGHAFPAVTRIAVASEAELRACKMGFRAPYVLAAARRVAAGALDLERLRTCGVDEARAALGDLPGVGEKIANCVLLFAYGCQQAFPVDVWVQRALRELYFPRRRPTEQRLRRFAATHFGENAGYAQQYLFHYTRVAARSRGGGH